MLVVRNRRIRNASVDTRWDAFAVAIHLGWTFGTTTPETWALPPLKSKGPRHYSAYEAYVANLQVNWKEGNKVCDQILRTPGPFEPDAGPWKFAKAIGHMPGGVFAKAKELSKANHTTLETIWHAIVITKLMEGRQKASASFWVQAGNRNAETNDIFGFVTAEAGFVVTVEPTAPFEQRLAACVKAITSMSNEQVNVFPEISAVHPSFENFLKCTTGVNLVGNAMDVTDRSVVQRCLGDADTRHVDQTFGEMNWIEVGNETNNEIRFFGRADIVEFESKVLLPALCELGKL